MLSGNVKTTQRKQNKKRLTDLVIDEISNEFVIGVDEFSLAVSPSVLPESLIARPSVCIAVRAQAMPDVVLPLSIIYVTVDVVEPAAATALIICPAPCHANTSRGYVIQLYLAIDVGLGPVKQPLLQIPRRVATLM